MGIDSLGPRRAVFFDRDGVLNEAVVRDGMPHPPESLASLRFTDGAVDAVAAVRAAGFLTIAVTNQPDVARRIATREAVEAINVRVADELALDGLYACFHDTTDDCECRKPKPGMLHRAAADYGIDLRASYVVGDRIKDIECGRAAGCATVFVDRGYAETPAHVGADACVASVRDAVGYILQREPAVQ